MDPRTHPNRPTTPDPEAAEGDPTEPIAQWMTTYLLIACFPAGLDTMWRQKLLRPAARVGITAGVATVFALILVVGSLRGGAAPQECPGCAGSPTAATTDATPREADRGRLPITAGLAQIFAKPRAGASCERCGADLAD